MASIDIRIVTDEQGFIDLAAAWSDLFERAADANTFLSHEWLCSWWRAYRPNAQLRILVASEAGHLVGIAPMMLASEARLGVPARVLRFIGDGTHETDHMNLLVDRVHAGAALSALLHATVSLDWNVAQFNQMPEASELTRAVRLFAEARWRTRVEAVPCPRCILPASYEALLASLPPRMRTSIRSTRRRLSQKYRVDFGMHESPDELDPALQALYSNHASRWQAIGQPGVFVDPRKRTFYSLLTPALLARGALRFYYLKLDGRIVAQEYCFAHEGTVMLLQEGFDYALAPENVGNALRAMVFERLISEGALVYDFLAGVSRHKRTWSNDTSNDLRIECDRGALGFLHVYPRRLLAAARSRAGGPLRHRRARPEDADR